MDQEYYGAASRLAQKTLGGIFQPLTSVVAVGVGAGKVIGANPNRITLVIVNAGTTTITLSPNPAVVSLQGIILVSQGSSMSLDYQKDADIPSVEWYGISSAIGGSVFVFEEVQAFAGGA